MGRVQDAPPTVHRMMRWGGGGGGGGPVVAAAVAEEQLVPRFAPTYYFRLGTTHRREMASSAIRSYRPCVKTAAARPELLNSAPG